MRQEPVQPKEKNWKFTEHLKVREIRKNPYLKTRFSSGILISDPDENLSPEVFNDLSLFLSENKIDGKEYRVVIEKSNVLNEEDHIVEFDKTGARIIAGGVDGFRRGVFFFEDILLSYCDAVPGYGIYHRNSWLKTRISRCFFGPIKRPPLNRDELLDDVDYYPEEYLNKLAHSGVNALWLTISFVELCGSNPDSIRRRDKLCRTVEKCLKYGIRIYLFCIEPFCMREEWEMFKRKPSMKGVQASIPGYFCICTSAEESQIYLYESMNYLFSAIPELGGMINISYGERPTSCLSVNFGRECQRCSKRSPGEIHAQTLGAMERGMHAAAPNAELISWLYVPVNFAGAKSSHDEILDIALNVPENVVLQYNFESGGEKRQLGKIRHTGDYWLSYEGPSDIFRKVAEATRSHGNNISAKIQVGCSHEVATVPFVPVPGLLYRKYREMRSLGVSDVMQCWFFGNYPGLMNRAAGLLAFEKFTDSEHDFLLRLARSEWGEHSENVVEAWELFADAYTNYPLENLFQYYGPVHDGLVWPLYLIPVDKPLAPTWKLEFGTSGDRYGECLGSFALNEVVFLMGRLADGWRNGVKIMNSLSEYFTGNSERLLDIRLCKALLLQFESAHAILEFYAMREKLLSGDVSVLNAMEQIVLCEIRRSSEMVELCEQDSRLGFHSEAEGYKYFPEKLLWRIDCLKKLLHCEFELVKERIHKGLPLMTPEKERPCNEADFWTVDFSEGILKITLENPPEPEYVVYIEEKRFYPPQRFILTEGQSLIYQPNGKWTDIRFNIIGKKYSWVGIPPLESRLIFGDYNPENMEFILKKQKRRFL